MKIITQVNKQILEDKLCSEIIANLQESIQKNGYANLLVSGGSTPIGLYQKLSKQVIDWKKVTIGLVDERFVPTNHKKSNEKLVKTHLLQNNAIKCLFVGLVYNMVSKEENLQLAEKIYEKFRARVDVCILGMGGDGHTASLFPKDEASKEGLSNKCNNLLLNSFADVKPIERITCSRYLINKSEQLYLMITGEEKLAVLESAKANELPIASFFETTNTKLKVYYSQK
ncbi:MAG: 6-phosphogluconolactonase [Planctomycetota bacterium]|jgi:6-phosphogluconolactonase|tara:strand:- start:725 stop:1408 length:684 start_codon:yes stop_codon:yes gene_type:complete